MDKVEKLKQLPPGVEKLYAGLADTPLVVPIPLVQYLMKKSGQGPIFTNASEDAEDMRLSQVISFTAQRFISSILTDAMQLPDTHPTLPREKNKNASSGRKVLTTDMLETSLLEYGVSLRRQPFYVNPSENLNKRQRILLNDGATKPGQSRRVSPDFKTL
mmetsp:Transcript_22430/g.39797  ORF Transcript_22430/g.39797 Transcript_22430/m.39797 type:complete len:160 (-) Transcript_22430:344-823(-)